MKELKFRAWNGKKMIDDVVPASETSIIELYDRYEWGETEVKAVEQYTGLKDKNGKEIYEGDIVAVKDNDIPFALANALTTEKYLVRFNKHRAAFTMVKSTRRRNFIRTFQNIKQDDIEVIGNIHENGDLLK